MQSKIESLFDQATKLSYDEACGMIPVMEMKGPGFFPGCMGTFSHDSDFQDKRVMVLGQDFDTEEKYCRIDKEKGEVVHNVTWRNLKILLNDLVINLNDCFFTNAYMGLRKGKGRSTGPSPAIKSPNFAAACRAFFKVQLTAIKPEVVLVLGKEPAHFVARTFPEEFPDWQNIGLLIKFYESEMNIGQVLSFESKNILFLFVLHPSMSIRHRDMLLKKGYKENETTLLKKHLKAFYSRKAISGTV